MNILTSIRFKRATASGWAAINPILESGRPGFETDTGKLKIGDGVSSWSDLSYFIRESDVSGTDPSGLIDGGTA